MEKKWSYEQADKFIDIVDTVRKKHVSIIKWDFHQNSGDFAQ